METTTEFLEVAMSVPGEVLKVHSWQQRERDSGQASEADRIKDRSHGEEEAPVHAKCLLQKLEVDMGHKKSAITVFWAQKKNTDITSLTSDHNCFPMQD